MSKEFTFKSAIAPYIEGFLEEKHLQGYKYFNEAKWMKMFDGYWISNGYGKTGLTIENLDQWGEKRDCEGAKCQTTRITVIRQFSIYLNGLGIPSYYPPINTKCTRPLVHVLCDEELFALFHGIDHYQPQKGSVDIKRLSVMYPVLFRLIYCCGLRISEACSLPVSNIDLTSGIITILNGKGDRDRLVYLPEDLKQLCTRYFEYLCNELKENPVYFFPGKDKDRPISDVTVRKRFDTCWNQTAYAAQCGRKPTVHSLRHTYVVKRLNLWMNQGLDMDHMSPYLSGFLGHKSFNETLYYYHFVEEAAQIIRQKDGSIDRIIPEVVRR